jgi:diguanylate cyclase (GGDEF)-like protein
MPISQVMRSILMRSTLARAHQYSLVLIVGLMLIPVTVSGWQLWKASDRIDYVAQVGVPGAHLIGRIDALMNKYRKEQWEYLALKPGDPERAETATSMTDEQAGMRELFAVYRTLPLQEEDRRALADFESDWYAYVAATALELPLADEGRYPEAIATFNEGDGEARWDALKADLESWRTHDVEVAATYREQSRRWALLSIIAVGVLLTAAITVAVGVSRLLKRRLTRGLNRLSAAADGIAAGSVDQRVEIDADDEIAEVARAFDGMVTYLNGVVRTIEDQARQLAALAHHDALTGLPNRRGWDTALDRAVSSAGTFSVAVIDIDHFKRYNDAFGHPAGDALLRDAAAVWRAGLRPHDLLARYGGEEFTVLAADMTPEALAVMLEQLQAGTPDGQTFSAGIASWDGSESPQALTARADQALYQAKRAGRNRVTVAGATYAV